MEPLRAPAAAAGEVRLGSHGHGPLSGGGHGGEAEAKGLCELDFRAADEVKSIEFH